VARWRGEPWQDLGNQPEVAGARARLAELYDTAVEELQVARRALGDTAHTLQPHCRLMIDHDPPTV
jgi:hypothetical protein